MSGDKPTLVVVENDPARRTRMMAAAMAEAFAVEQLDSQRGCLNRLRQGLPDALLLGANIQGGSTMDLLSLTRAAYPQVPVLLCVPAETMGTLGDVAAAGAFDMVRSEDNPMPLRWAIRRVGILARARHQVVDERGRILGVQTKLGAIAPAVDFMLEALADTLSESLTLPDISLRTVEMLCARALSRFWDDALVALLAYEKKTGTLKLRATSFAAEAPEAESYPLVSNPTDGLSALMKVSENAELTEQVRERYQCRQTFLAMVGPESEPYGVAAYMTQHHNPPTPDECVLLQQLASHAGHCIRMARHFRVLVRKIAASQG